MLFEDPSQWLQNRVQSHLTFLKTPHDFGSSATTMFCWNWGIQFFGSWAAFLMYMYIDYKNHADGTLEKKKLPSRHPMVPFWESQFGMIPLVLFNQMFVWTMILMFIIWPIWMTNQRTVGEYWGWTIVPVFMVCSLISDQMWYWGHRFMHTRYAWIHWHKMHHIAPQSAISATYVHPVEYGMFCFSMLLPFAIAGIPWYVHAPFLLWGMFTGSGAHSGYSGWSDGDKHNAHHFHHNVNFGLLMIADMIYGTHWAPGDAPPREWVEARKIRLAYTEIIGNEEASTHGRLYIHAHDEAEARGEKPLEAPVDTKKTK